MQWEGWLQALDNLLRPLEGRGLNSRLAAQVTAAAAGVLTVLALSLGRHVALRARGQPCVAACGRSAASSVTCVHFSKVSSGELVCSWPALVVVDTPREGQGSSNLRRGGLSGGCRATKMRKIPTCFVSRVRWSHRVVICRFARPVISMPSACQTRNTCGVVLRQTTSA